VQQSHLPGLQGQGALEHGARPRIGIAGLAPLGIGHAQNTQRQDFIDFGAVE